MSIPRQYAYTEPDWYIRRMPTLEDFNGDEEAFQTAMDQYVNDQNGSQLSDVPNFGIPEQQIYNHQTGQYETRGGMPKRFEGMSQGEFYGNSPHGRAFNELIPVSELNDEEIRRARMAYDSTRSDGTPVLADPMLAWLEHRFGFKPGENAMWAPPTTEQPPAAPVTDPNAVEYPGGPSPFGPENTWTVQPDGSMVNENGDVWTPGQGTLLPNSNPAANIQTAQADTANIDPGTLWAELWANGGVPGLPLLPADGTDLGIAVTLPPSSDVSPFDPADFQAFVDRMRQQSPDLQYYGAIPSSADPVQQIAEYARASGMSAERQQQMADELGRLLASGWTPERAMSYLLARY